MSQEHRLECGCFAIDETTTMINPDCKTHYDRCPKSKNGYHLECYSEISGHLECLKCGEYITK